MIGISAGDPLMQQALQALLQCTEAEGAKPAKEVERLRLEVEALMTAVSKYQLCLWVGQCHYFTELVNSASDSVAYGQRAPLVPAHAQRVIGITDAGDVPKISRRKGRIFGSKRGYSRGIRKLSRLDV